MDLEFDWRPRFDRCCRTGCTFIARPTAPDFSRAELRYHDNFAVAFNSGLPGSAAVRRSHWNLRSIEETQRRLISDLGWRLHLADAIRLLRSKTLFNERSFSGMSGDRATSSFPRALVRSALLRLFLNPRDDILPVRRRRKLFPNRPCLRRDVTCRKTLLP